MGVIMGFFKLFKSKKRKENKYKSSLHKQRDSLGNLTEILNKSTKIDEDLFLEIEDILIMADMGVETTLKFVSELRNVTELKKITDPLLLKEIIVDEMFNLYLEGDIIDTNLNYSKDELNVYLFVGVNGTGKTTSIAKLANILKKENNKVMVIAGDTFRAGAIDQLEVWAKRAEVDFFKKESGSDPSSVIYDGLTKAKKENYNVVLIDTAGRLHNKTNLMNELNKMYRVIERVTDNKPKEIFLVIDATTGQNGLKQAETFKEVTDVSSVILTKLDGSSKGGIVLAIKNIYKIPIKYVGVGEGINDLLVFDIEDYIYGLFESFFEE